MGTILGTVENGVVKLPADAGLADGITVRVEAVVQATPPAGEDPGAGLSFYERYKEFIGMAEGPGDMAINHDHYLYGTPKRQEDPLNPPPE